MTDRSSTSPGLRSVLPRLDDRLALGSDLRISPFCLGMVSDPRAVLAAFDAGINFFFVTADMHWPLYEATRRGLAALFARGAGIRDRVVVAAVSYVARAEFCHAPFRELVAEISGLDRLDLTVAGGAAVAELDMRKREFRKHRELGARAFGASFHERTLAAREIAARGTDISFVRYNPVHRGAERDLFPLIGDRSPALVFNFKSTVGFLRPADYANLGVSEDHWQPAVTDYYRFALARPELDGLLCALTRPEHVDALARALEDGPLTEEETDYIRDLADLACGKAELVVT
jgi:aryl-alcohol dehydrogenase-like predicted oxidoreductase